MIVTSSVPDADPEGSRRRMRPQIRPLRARESDFEAIAARSDTRPKNTENSFNLLMANKLGRRPRSAQRVGVTDYTYRDYEPLTGRWLSRDPIQERGGVNLYGFVGNDGVNQGDLLGMVTLQEAHDSFKKRGGGPLTPSPRWILTHQEIFDEWYRLEKAQGSWWSSLPKCPKKLCIKKINRGGTEKAFNSYAADRSQWNEPDRPTNAEENLHPGTIWSMRSKADGAGHANQCTYDTKGILLRTPPGSGTVDWYRSGTQTHYNHDVAPVYLANSLDGGASMGVISSTLTGGPSILGTPGANLNKYFEVRPLWAESP